MTSNKEPEDLGSLIRRANEVRDHLDRDIPKETEAKVSRVIATVNAMHKEIENVSVQFHISEYVGEDYVHRCDLRFGPKGEHTLATLHVATVNAERDREILCLNMLTEICNLVETANAKKTAAEAYSGKISRIDPGCTEPYRFKRRITLLYEHPSSSSSSSSEEYMMEDTFLPMYKRDGTVPNKTIRTIGIILARAYGGVFLGRGYQSEEVAKREERRCCWRR